MPFMNRGAAAVFVFALVFAALAGASPALGEEETTTKEQCQSKWDSSSASDTCDLDFIAVELNKCLLTVRCKTNNPDWQPQNRKLVALDSMSGLTNCNGRLKLANQQCYH